MKTGLLYHLAGVLFVTSVLMLDCQGVFIYFTYLPVYAGGVLYVGWGVRFVRASERVRRSWAILISAALIGIFSTAVPHLPNGERKKFFLTASSIQEGTSEAKIKETMRNYRLTENPDGSLTFSYRTRPQTEDHFVVILDPVSRSAKSTEFLAD